MCWTRRRKIVGFIGPAARQHLPLPEQDFVALRAVESHVSHPEPSFVMSANNSALAQQRCPRCAQPMKLIRRTQRFGGLPDLCTFECAACSISHTEECKPTHGTLPMYAESRRRHAAILLGSLGVKIGRFGL